MSETGVGRRAAVDPRSTAAGTASPAGILVPGYELIAELGHGAATVVYRARRVSGDPGPDVALKMVREPTDDPAVAVAFRREAALLARAAHPCLGAVHAVGEAGGRPYLVLELVEGVALARLIEKGGLPDDRVVQVGIDAADALAAAHRMRLVHRDVKPQNLLVSDSGRTRLIDFDLATWTDELAPADSVAGTLTYSAPEQTGMLTRPVDARTDLYALGVVLFECVTGRPPFTSPDVGELLRLHAVEPPPDVRDLRPECSAALAAVIAKLLAKDPDDRYQSAAGLLGDLRRVQADAGDWPFTLDLDSAGVLAHGSAPPLIGRDAELAQLTRRWNDASSRGGAVLLEGRAGEGRTRLATELLGRVTAGGGCALAVRCSPDDPQSLGAIGSAVQRHIEAVQKLPPDEQPVARERMRLAAGAAAALLATLSPTVAAVLGADGAALVGADRQAQIPTAIATFLVALAQIEGRLLLVIDDAHHIDTLSERVLSHLRLNDEDAPLLVVSTAQTAGMASPTPGAGVPFDRRIPLGPLDPPAIKELIASELGGADVPDDVGGQLAARTGGNPFAILEYLRYLIEAGGVQPSWGTWLLDRELLDRLHLPSDVLDLVLARMEGLGATPRRLLAAAAVQGMRFDVTVMASTGVAAPDEIAVAIASATRRRMVEHVSGDVYAFVHAELRDALLADLGEAGIADQHRRIAEALDARPETGTEHIHALARHWMAAGVASERAFAACAAAGRTALAQHAPDDAVEFLSGAVGVAARAGIAVDVPLRRSHATALLRAGDFDGAIAQLNDALAVEQDPLRRAELMNLLAIAEHSAGEGERAIVTIRRGLAEVGTALPRSLPLLMLSTIARFVAGLAVGAARGRLGRATGVRLQRYALEASLLETGMYAASVVVNDRMLVVFLLRGLLPANRIGHSPERVRSLAGLGYLAGMAGMPRLGLRVCGAAERAAADLGDPTLVALASWMRGVVGSIATARMAPVADALDAHGRWLDLPYYLAAVAGVVPQLVGVGYTSVAEMWVGRARKRLRLGGSAREAFPIECMAGAIQAVRGRATDADDTLQAACEGVDGDLTVEQRLHLAWAKLIILTEQGEFGDAFDEVAAAIDAARMPAGNHITIAMRYTVTFGRLAQAHAATGADRQHRLAQARDGIRALRRARHQPRLDAGRLMFRAWALLIAGRARAAQRMLHRALRAADGADAPQLSFDLMVVHARVLRALRLEPEAQRQATSALMLAGECGWVYRARWIRDEFGLRDSADGTRRSLLHSSGPGSSAGHTGIHQRRRLEAVTQVSAAAASVLDPEELIRVALEVTMRLLSAERIFVFIARRRPGTADTVLVPHSGRDVDGNHLTELTNYSSTLVDRVWKSGEALVVTGTEHGAALGSESAVVHGLRSILVAPLQLKGRVLGVIYLDSRVARGIFAGDDADLLVTITQQVSASLETARAAQLEVAVRAANQQRDLAETLRASMADLNSTLDPEEVLHRLLQVVGTTLPGEHAVLLRHGHDEMRLVAPPGHASHHAGATELVVALDDDTTLAALGAIDAPVVGGGGTPPDLSDRVSRALGQPRSWLAIPVLLRQQSTGVVIVGSAQPGSYHDVHVEVAAALAEQAAVAYENARLFSRVEELATTDGLTALATRHHFWQLAEEHLALVARDGRRPLAAIMLDIDHFKLVNDTHGHAAGDAVLREVADRLRALTGAADILGRYGGEEFALIVPDTTDAGGYAERLRAAVAGAPVPAGGAAVPVTISVGVSYHRAGDDLDALFGRADGALYRSKADGRNRVTVA
jgi:diguanylate cyclase (GGDEF)-like protein